MMRPKCLGTCSRRDSIQVPIEKGNSPSIHVLTIVHIHQKTLDLVVSRRCCAESGKEMYQNVKRTGSAIVLLIEIYCFLTFSLPSSSLLKLPNIKTVFLYLRMYENSRIVYFNISVHKEEPLPSHSADSGAFARPPSAFQR